MDIQRNAKEYLGFWWTAVSNTWQPFGKSGNTVGVLLTWFVLVGWLVSLPALITTFRNRLEVLNHPISTFYLEYTWAFPFIVFGLGVVFWGTFRAYQNEVNAHNEDRGRLTQQIEALQSEDAQTSREIDQLQEEKLRIEKEEREGLGGPTI